ncbi:hypothetical protein Tco_0320871 [Tanacetum coccineum]
MDNEIDNDMGSDEMGSDHSIEMVADQGDENESEHGGAEEEFSDHDDDNIVDEEHIIDELEVNMEGVIDFDSFDSDIGDDSDSERRVALRKLKKEGKQNAAQSRIANYFLLERSFPTRMRLRRELSHILWKQGETSDLVESSDANQSYIRSNAKTVTVGVKRPDYPCVQSTWVD